MDEEGVQADKQSSCSHHAREHSSVAWVLPSTTGDEVYYMGIIDILQLYNMNKQLERFCKVCFLRKDKVGYLLATVAFLTEFLLFVIIQTSGNNL